MSDTTATRHRTGAPAFALTFVIVVALCLLRAILPGASADALFTQASNDDIMRLLSVRSLLDGQNWFDMTQTAVLPPEGVSLHWSRYVDLGPAALMAAFGLVLPPEQAEAWAALVWPVLLLAALLAVVGFGTRRLFGPLAGAMAMVVLFMMASISVGYFGPGRLDHHNVQILLMTLATFAALWPDQPRQGGILAGLAVALSLATGLETLFYLVALALLLVVRSAFAQPMAQSNARARMTAFCLTLMLAAPLAHMGQTAPGAWMQAACDKLSPPMLSVVWVGGLAALSVHALPSRWAGPVPSLLLTAAVALVGLGLIYPLIGSCLTDPYGHLPPAAQDLIATGIIEALPLTDFAARYPATAVELFLPAFGAVTLAALLWLVAGRGQADSAAPLLLILAGVGVVTCAVQVRQIVLLAPVVPALAGYALARAYDLRAGDRPGLGGPALLGGLALILLPAVAGERLTLALTPRDAGPGGSPGSSAGAALTQDADCAIPSVIETLNAAAPGTVLTPLNLGPKVSAFSHHAALSAPYHRSAAALLNGYAPFTEPAEGLIRAARDSGASYILVCAGSSYGESAATRLARGEVLPGFQPVDTGTAPLLLFKTP